MKKQVAKSACIIIRLSQEDKAYFKKQAKRYCITLTELMLRSLKNQTIKDYKVEQQTNLVLQNLTKEVNYIGHNINQATVALHQLRITARPDTGELCHFNKLLDTYQQLMQDYKLIIQKLMQGE